MKEYDPKEIEPKWQAKWAESGIYTAKENGKPKWYSLIEFPYPSGEGLHVGHPRPYIGMDVVSRKRRMQGYDVLYPIGYDAFGLPTENYAIKTGRKPADITRENILNFRKQIESLAVSFDWSREVNTSDPAYYKWTQWLFLKFLEHSLAYKDKIAINWCPKDKIGLANEEVVDGKCERCGTPVERREKEQWMLKITAYADRLYKDLDDVDYPERVKAQQRNWIGRSEGAEIDFDTTVGEKIRIFTTRPDTIFGATYMVLAPEHAFVMNNSPAISNLADIEGYVAEVKNRSELERTAEGKDKTGVELKGIRAINPATKEEIPIWIADYVLPHYGTGAIMAVPAHDQRDWEFAKKFSLPMVEVIEFSDEKSEVKERYSTRESLDLVTVYEERFGRLINSGPFTGRHTPEVIDELIEFIGGEKKTTFKLRDWVFSRQRYWGEPIPVVHCDKCGIVPVPESDLPVMLPEVEKYEPTDNGDSPLAAIPDWVNTTCPKCGGDAKRETDTMPNWAGSSWYFLRYTDPHNPEEFASKEALKHWMPVDWYNGGMEHTTLHLLYSRFWNKFFFDIGLVPTSEPYKKRTSHGFILAENGEKMSKSRGNVVNPDTIVDQFGTDTFRVYEMFMGPFEQAISWSESSLVGPRRFIERVWKLADKVSADTTASSDDERVMNETIQKVAEDIETMSFNTAVSALMVYANYLEKRNAVSKEEFNTLLLLLAPFAPHVTEELWTKNGGVGSIHEAQWPVLNEEKLQRSNFTYAVQVDGKVRATLNINATASEDEVKAAVMELPEVKKWLNGAVPKKVIVVLGRIVNIVL